MDRAKTAPNIPIIALVPAAAFFLPGGGQATSLAQTPATVAFGAAIGLNAPPSCPAAPAPLPRAWQHRPPRP